MNRWFRFHRLRYFVLATVLAVFVITALTTSTLNLSAQSGPWEGRYWNNRDLSGNPVLVRQDASINFDWGGGSPATEVFTDNFSAQWTQTATLPAGTYRFSATADDGIRVWVDNTVIIDAWYDSQVRTITADVFLGAGTHTITVRYYEAGGLAVAKMSYVALNAPPPPPSGNWFNEYFTNTSLSGAPTLTGTTTDVNFNWGFGTPTAGFPADFFSVRWVRNLNLDAGRYRFTVIADDGVRLWVNNALVIDQWRVQAATTYNVEVDLPGGAIPIKMEYFENTERAEARLSWTRVSTPPPATAVWRAEYFNNMTLSGLPVIVRDEGAVNYNWGYGTPAPQIPVDHFSARWTMNLSLAPGRYRVSATSDDGVRVWVNNQLLIDSWWDRPAQTFNAEFTTNGGAVPVRIEYYENTALAEMRFSYTQLTGQPGTGGQFPGTATVTAHRLNVRTGPGVNFPSFARLSNGNIVALTGFRNGDATWVQIVTPTGTAGWVSALYVSTSIPLINLTPITGSTPAPAPPAGAVGTVNTGALNVRTGPAVNYPTITTLDNGAAVTLLARNAASTWVKVILRDGRQGWVNASFMILNVPISTLPVANF